MTICNYCGLGLCCVITSYSIHYTKLYDCSGSKEVSFQRLYGDTRYYIQLSTQGKHRDAFTLTQIRGGGIDQTALLNSLISRITSYNVCYTKLLRTGLCPKV